MRRGRTQWFALFYYPSSSRRMPDCGGMDAEAGTRKARGPQGVVQEHHLIERGQIDRSRPRAAIRPAAPTSFFITSSRSGRWPRSVSNRAPTCAGMTNCSLFAKRVNRKVRPFLLSVVIPAQAGIQCGQVDRSRPTAAPTSSLLPPVGAAHGRDRCPNRTTSAAASW